MKQKRKHFASILSMILALAMMATVAIMPASAAALSEAQTSYGFFKSVGATQALKLLNNAPKRSYIKKGNPNSATSLTNMLNSLKVIEETNKYRAQEGKSALKVTDSAMAMAQANADVSTVTGNHAVQFNLSNYGYGHMARAENLAPYPDASSAVAAWYNEKYGTGEKGHYRNIVDKTYGEAGAAVSNLNQRVYIEDFQDANTSEKKYTVSQYRTRLKNYMNQVGASTSSKSQSSKPTATSTSDLGNVQMKYTITPVENTNSQSNNGTTRNSNGVYSCTTSTVAHSTTGKRNDYTDYRGTSFNAWPKQDGKVYVYVQELTNDDMFGFYADIRIFNGTSKTITLQDMPKLNIYSDDGLICSDPSSVGFGVGKTLAPNSQAVLLRVHFNNVNANKNFTTGTLRVESTITYTLA